MNDNELAILNYVKNRCRGKANAKTYKHLSLLLGINERELRHIVSDLVTNRIACIGSTCADGYFYIDTDQEADHCSRELIKKAKKILLRAKAIRLTRATDKQLEKPEQLEFEGAGINGNI